MTAFIIHFTHHGHTEIIMAPNAKTAFERADLYYDYVSHVEER